MAAVPLVDYARAASKQNAAFVARQLQRAAQAPRRLSPAPAEATAAPPGRAAAVQQAARELRAAYAEDVVPLFAGLAMPIRSHARRALREGRAPHEVRMRRRRGACLWGLGMSAPRAEAGAVRRASAGQLAAWLRPTPTPLLPGRACRSASGTPAMRSCRGARTPGARCSCCPRRPAGDSRSGSRPRWTCR